MRFNKTQPDPKASWHKWFAWRPVRVPTLLTGYGFMAKCIFETVWLESVLRKISWYYADEWYPETEYKLIEKNNK